MKTVHKHTTFRHLVLLPSLENWLLL